jgi:hypothetical protein
MCSWTGTSTGKYRCTRTVPLSGVPGTRRSTGGNRVERLVGKAEQYRGVTSRYKEFQVICLACSI